MKKVMNGLFMAVTAMALVAPVVQAQEQNSSSIQQADQYCPEGDMGGYWENSACHYCVYPGYPYVYVPGLAYDGVCANPKPGTGGGGGYCPEGDMGGYWENSACHYCVYPGYPYVYVPGLAYDGVCANPKPGT